MCPNKNSTVWLVLLLFCFLKYTHCLKFSTSCKRKLFVRISNLETSYFAISTDWTCYTFQMIIRLGWSIWTHTCVTFFFFSSFTLHAKKTFYMSCYMNCDYIYQIAVSFTYSMNFLFSYTQLPLDIDPMIENNEIVRIVLFASLFSIIGFKFKNSLV